MDFVNLGKKWQNSWEKAKLFEANPSRKKKFFTSNIIPYVNGDIHIGHTYTYTRTDAYARFKRMQGYNVLLSQGFHATGEPIVGAVKRLKEGDEKQISTFKLFGATDQDLENFKINGPKYVARFWSEKIEDSLKLMGFSIDWRRKFTLSIDPQFSRFVEWQYNTLRKKGYVTQGTHPVVWCPQDKSPTGDHDRLQGEGESPVEYVLLKFRFEDSYLPAATLRPETIYGVTNIWINPDADYVKVNVAGEMWIVSKRAAEKLSDQISDLRVVGKVDTKSLFSKRATAPVTNRYVPVLPARFVDPNSATGIVMSVPSHAPYDWVALKALVESNELEKYGVLPNEMGPVSVIKSALGEHPAIEVCKEMGIASTGETDALDKATSEVYKKEFHSGVLKDNTGPYKGMRVIDAKDKIKIDLIDKGLADLMYEIQGVVCRCGTACHVKILENQWFLKYSDVQWKKTAKKCLAGMTILPEEARNNFENTIDWLNDKACARRSGLGTPLPWDREWIVETLSDSTVYMAFYTIAGIISREKIPAEKLTDEVFDYVFMNKGHSSSLSKNVGIKKTVLDEMRREFKYFYPVDIRNSAKDLVQNHLTFYIFHHVALWSKENWPKAVSINGYVNVESEKMSKSKGNILPIKLFVEKLGPDPVRINILAAAEGIDDPNWKESSIKSYKTRLEFLSETIQKIGVAKSRRVRNPEKYLQSAMQGIILETTDAASETRFRSATQAALFDSTNIIRWYLKRVGGIENSNSTILKNVLSATVRLLAPITPHVCEEMWHSLGNSEFVSVAEWPKYDKNLVNKNSEISERFLKNIMADIEDVKKLAKIDAKKATIFFAEDWKFAVYNEVISNKEEDLETTLKKLMKSDLRRYGKATLGFVNHLRKKIDSLGNIPSRQTQMALLKDAKEFLQNETGLEVSIEDASKSENPKSKSAMPHKPGILLE